MKRVSFLLPLLLVMVCLTGCRDHDYIEEDNYDNDADAYDVELVDLDSYPDWSELTHSNAVEPNFDVVFAQDEVLRLDITITSSNWSAMWSDLASNLSSSNSMFNRGGVANDNNDLDFTPIWVPCTITFNETNWYQVGVRFKGNSSLSTTYSSGNQKLSMKLDFDQYEDDYPALTNQRFYGFKQLNLNNNYNDASLMREKVSSDLFRRFGIASANTSFYAVYIDTGSGPEYFGIYTLVEEVDDSLIGTQFASGSGNLYKPEDDAASFKSGTYDQSEFNLKTNTDVADYSDVRSLYDALHDTSYINDIDGWKAQLESVFDVDTFMKWLAANLVMQNWDTYGNMTHNYFLYNNPSNNKLTWIPWDGNESLQDGNSSIEINKVTKVSTSWPLISYLIAVDEYNEIYEGYLKQFVDEVFTVDYMQVLYDNYYYMLQDYAYDEVTGRTFIYYNASFDSAILTLKEHVEERNDKVEEYFN
ncbi:MAG: CotH kinase family protein [Rikenellaceae bacterium]